MDQHIKQKWKTKFLLTSEGLASMKKPTIGANSFPSLHPEEEKTASVTNHIASYGEKETKRETNNPKRKIRYKNQKI